MSYCRFENTAQDLEDCLEHFGEDLSGDEFKARNKIIEMAREIIDIYDDYKFEEVKE